MNDLQISSFQNLLSIFEYQMSLTHFDPFLVKLKFVSNDLVLGRNSFYYVLEVGIGDGVVIGSYRLTLLRIDGGLARGLSIRTRKGLASLKYRSLLS